ncbi:hypothetical protein IPL85_05035 [Candidatus Saccharibacteria bacterium]|nr:MAG: hypothetical protein IPL85_05035 [Candidatus Saccharibacteria bacterium]
MARAERNLDWNRYQHAGSLIHHLLQHRLAESGFVGMPQGEASIGEITTAFIGELDYLRIMEEGIGRTVLNGLQGTLNSMPLRMLGRIGTIGGKIPLHDAQISRNVLERDGQAPPEYCFSRVGVKVVGYNASGKIGKYEPPQFKLDFAKFVSYNDDDKPVSTIFLVPRNENVTPSGFVISDPLGYCIGILEQISSNLPKI